ncbi:hypothetical protein Nepgr_026678 [Nepenthes gracilis]|uniref:Uncharacterized protein n=1 Tax=Nepenthes gracilis TaxID=150966 RepID=A0AAD3T8E2_NEPGR|nr:hypothetical protein Nepgr_026678 [Nepenthes gracilis]
MALDLGSQDVDGPILLVCLCGFSFSMVSADAEDCCCREKRELLCCCMQISLASVGLLLFGLRGGGKAELQWAVFEVLCVGLSTSLGVFVFDSLGLAAGLFLMRSGGIPKIRYLGDPITMPIPALVWRLGFHCGHFLHSFSCDLETTSLSDRLVCGPCLAYTLRVLGLLSCDRDYRMLASFIGPG